MSSAKGADASKLDNPAWSKANPQFQGLGYRLAGMAQILGRVPLTEPVNQYLAPNQFIMVHRQHPF
jgi:hypothetical protein